MKLNDALEIVLELARGNALSEDDVADNPDIETERRRQQEALETVERLLVNKL